MKNFFSGLVLCVFLCSGPTKTAWGFFESDASARLNIADILPYLTKGIHAPRTPNWWPGFRRDEVDVWEESYNIRPGELLSRRLAAREFIDSPEHQRRIQKARQILLPGSSTKMNVSLNLIVGYTTVGHITLDVHNFVERDGQLFYRLAMRSYVDNIFVKMNCKAESLVSYDTFQPISMHTYCDSNKHYLLARNEFDWESMSAYHAGTYGKNREREVFHWNLEPDSQNLLSAFFYLRLMDFSEQKSGSSIKSPFIVSERGKNVPFTIGIKGRKNIKTPFGRKRALALETPGPIGRNWEHPIKVLLGQDSQRELLQLRRGRFIRVKIAK